MKTALTALTLIAGLALTGCTAPTVTPTITQFPVPSVADAGTKIEAGTPEKLLPNVFKDAASGVTITAPEDTIVVPWTLPDTQNGNEILATTSFKRPGGKIYTALVFKKEAHETLEQWSARSGWGDAALPGEDEPNARIVTKSGEIAYVYKVNDFGLLPDIHVVVATKNSVYRFQWNDPRIPEGVDTAVQYLKAHQDDEMYWKVPQDFIEFVKNVEVN